MKKRSRLTGLFSLAALTFVVGGCQSVEDELGTLQDGQVQQGDKVQVTFQAVAPTVGTEGSRTTLVDGKSVYWNSGDAIAVFPDLFVGKITNDQKFVTNDIPDGKYYFSASFTGYIEPDYQGAYTAFYPFECADYYHLEGYLGFVIPTLQTAVAETFAPHTNPAWARIEFDGEDNTYGFQNIGSLVKITLTDVTPDLESITLTDKGGRTLSGDLALNVTNPAASLLSELPDDPVCAASVTLKGNFEEGGSYYFVIAPLENVLSEGFTMTFQKKDGTTFVKNGKNNVITNLGPSQIADLGTVSLKNAVYTESIKDLNFIAAVEQSAGITFDKNGDGSVPFTDANIEKMASIEKLDIEGKGIRSLEGIAYFTGLEYLDCSDNDLVDLDVSALKNLQTLMCRDNFLYKINVTGLSSLSYFECSNNNLSELDVSSLTGLIGLHCGRNCLSTLDISSLETLFELNCRENNLTDLNLAGLKNIKALYCDQNKLQTLDVSGLSGLLDLTCAENELTMLDVSNLTSLITLGCNNNQITTLDVNNLVNLEYLVCGFNQLTALDVSGLVNLTVLECDNNNGVDNSDGIAVLDVRNLVHLKRLVCQGNVIRELDVSNLTQLEELYCSMNLITELDVNNLSNMTRLECTENQLKVLDITSLVKLTTLRCAGNRLKELDLSNQRYLQFCSCTPQYNDNQGNRISVILNATMQDWWDNLSPFAQDMIVVTWVD